MSGFIYLYKTHIKSKIFTTYAFGSLGMKLANNFLEKMNSEKIHIVCMIYTTEVSKYGNGVKLCLNANKKIKFLPEAMYKNSVFHMKNKKTDEFYINEFITNSLIELRKLDKEKKENALFLKTHDSKKAELTFKEIVQLNISNKSLKLFNIRGKIEGIEVKGWKHLLEELISILLKNNINMEEINEINYVSLSLDKKNCSFSKHYDSGLYFRRLHDFKCLNILKYLDKKYNFINLDNLYFEQKS